MCVPFRPPGSSRVESSRCRWSPSAVGSCPGAAALGNGNCRNQLEAASWGPAVVVVVGGVGKDGNRFLLKSSLTSLSHSKKKTADKRRGSDGPGDFKRRSFSSRPALQPRSLAARAGALAWQTPVPSQPEDAGGRSNHRPRPNESAVQVWLWQRVSAHPANPRALHTGGGRSRPSQSAPLSAPSNRQTGRPADPQTLRYGRAASWLVPPHQNAVQHKRPAIGLAVLACIVPRPLCWLSRSVMNCRPMSPHATIVRFSG